MISFSPGLQSEEVLDTKSAPLSSLTAYLRHFHQCRSMEEGEPEMFKVFAARGLQCIEEEGRALGFVILKIDWKLSIIFITTLTLDIKGTLTKSKLWSSSSPSSWISRLVAHRPSWQSISRLLPLPPSLLLVIFMQSGFWQWPGSCFKNFLDK